MKHVLALVVLILLIPNSGNTQSFEEARQYCDLTMDKGSVLFRFAWDALQERKMSEYIVKGRILVGEIPKTQETEDSLYFAEILYLMAWSTAVSDKKDGKSFETSRINFVNRWRRWCLDYCLARDVKQHRCVDVTLTE